MVEFKEFIEYLNENPGKFDYITGTFEKGMPETRENFVPGVNGGVVVHNKLFDAETHFTNDALKNMDWSELIRRTNGGRNVEQMTRVTGYFSVASRYGKAGWNKGKMGELKDRRRTPM